MTRFASAKILRDQGTIHDGRFRLPDPSWSGLLYVQLCRWQAAYGYISPCFGLMTETLHTDRCQLGTLRRVGHLSILRMDLCSFNIRLFRSEPLALSGPSTVLLIWCNSLHPKCSWSLCTTTWMTSDLPSLHIWQSNLGLLHSPSSSGHWGW